LIVLFIFYFIANNIIAKNFLCQRKEGVYFLKDVLDILTL